MSIKSTNNQKGFQWLMDNREVLDEALRYWAAREYNGFEIGEQLIDEMYEILGMENELSTMNFTSMGLFENKYILDSED